MRDDLSFERGKKAFAVSERNIPNRTLFLFCSINGSVSFSSCLCTAYLAIDTVPMRTACFPGPLSCGLRCLYLKSHVKICEDRIFNSNSNDMSYLKTSSDAWLGYHIKLYGRRESKKPTRAVSLGAMREGRDDIFTRQLGKTPNISQTAT